MTRSLSVGLLLAALIAPAVVLAQPAATDEEARALFDAGRLAYSNGRYDEALQYFQKAYDLSKRAPLLYNIANTFDRLRRDEEALHNFEEFVKQVPGSDYVPAANERIAFLRAAIAARKTDARAAAPAPAAPAPVAPTPAQTAAAASAPPAHPQPVASEADTGPVDRGEGGSSVTGKWWFWTAVGVVAAGAIVGIALASGGGTKPAAPLAFDGNTRDVRL